MLLVVCLLGVVPGHAQSVRAGAAWSKSFVIDPDANREFLAWQNARAVKRHYAAAVAAGTDDAGLREKVMAALVAGHEALQGKILRASWDGAKRGERHPALREVMVGSLRGLRNEVETMLGREGMELFQRAEVQAAIEVELGRIAVAEATDGMNAVQRGELRALLVARLLGADGLPLPAARVARQEMLDAAAKILSAGQLETFERRWGGGDAALSVLVPLVSAPGMESQYSIQALSAP